MTENICFSGGCEGADKLWGELARQAGHKVVHFAFAGMKTSCDPKTLLRLNMFYLLQADPFLKEANKYLGRQFPTQSTYVDNLLRRNYYQVADTRRVYAISALGKRGMVDGGTGWAVTMAIVLRVPEIYLYDCKTSKWMVFKHINKNEFEWDIAEAFSVGVPYPSGAYTGIGKHDLPENGRRAIEYFYGTTEAAVA